MAPFYLDLRRGLLLCLVGSALAFPHVAHADPSRGSEAQALFEEARKLAEENRWGEACPKFAASQQFDPGAGTLLNLANCYEKNGQTASAWGSFKEAAAMAKQQQHAEWEALARARALAIEPTLSRLTILVPPESRVEGLEVKRNGVALASGAWGSPLPLDPQAHIVEATAPGRKKWVTTVTLAPDGATSTVTIPTLEAAPEPPATEVAQASSGVSPQKITGVVIAGLGLVGLGIGSVTGLLAVSKAKDSRKLCPGSTCNPDSAEQADGFRANEDARGLANISTFAFVIGGAALAAGGILFFTAPRATVSPPSAARIRIAPAGDKGSLGVSVFGAW